MTSVNDRLLNWGHAQRTRRQAAAARLRAKYAPPLLPTPRLNMAWPHVGTRCPRSARWPLNGARWWMARCGWSWTPWGWFFNRYIPMSPGGRLMRGMFVASWTIVAVPYAFVASMAAIALTVGVWLPATILTTIARSLLAWCGWIRYTPLPPSGIPDTIPASWATEVRLPELDDDDPWSWNERNDPMAAMQREGLRLQALAVDEIRRANDLAERGPQFDTAPVDTPQGVPVSGRALIPAALVVAAAAVALVLSAYHGAPDPGLWDTIHATAEARP